MSDSLKGINVKMKIKIIFVNFVSAFLLLVACSLTPDSSDLGGNFLGFENSEVDLPVIGATSLPALSIQQEPDCSERPLPVPCQLNANGQEVIVIFNADISPSPKMITSQIGFKSAKIDFSLADLGTSMDDLPSSFSFKAMDAEFWAQDGRVSGRPSNPDVTLSESLSESDLMGIVFVKGSCVNQVCDYSVQGAGAETIITVKITSTNINDFLAVLSGGSSENTLGLILDTKINDNMIPDQSIIKLTLTNPSTLAQF